MTKNSEGQLGDDERTDVVREFNECVGELLNRSEYSWNRFFAIIFPTPNCDWATTFLHRLPSKQTVGERSEQNVHKVRKKLGQAIG